MSREIVTTVYSFDELTKEAQQRAVDDWNEHDDMPFLSDDMQEYLTEVLLPKYGMTCEDPKIYYSLSYCQGDGAMFEGTVDWKAWRVEIRQNGHYYHYNSKQFWNFTSRKTGKEPSDATFNKFNDAYVALCQELEKYGYAEIEAAREFDNVADTIRANEYEFTAEGKMI